MFISTLLIQAETLGQAEFLSVKIKCLGQFIGAYELLERMYSFSKQDTRFRGHCDRLAT